ncbi:MAG: DnaK suppressor protein [Pseudonocardiales bacterium]|nr:DnaK suppressor protein [Pseudonocardiales bacterium]
MTDPRSRLDALRAETLGRIATLRAELDDVIGSASSTTGDDEHDPEGATIGFERAQAQALLDAAQTQLVAIEAALARVDAGTYGVCVVCGRPIGEERLQARPAADRCIACAS